MIITITPKASGKNTYYLTAIVDSMVKKVFSNTKKQYSDDLSDCLSVNSNSEVVVNGNIDGSREEAKKLLV